MQIWNGLQLILFILIYSITGSVQDAPITGRSIMQEDRTQIVQETLEQLMADHSHAVASSSQVARISGVPKSSCYRILLEF